MLLKRSVLDRIAVGEVDLVFRRWKRPTVKTGGSLRTSIGLLAIDRVDRVSLRSISPAEARRAGFSSKAALLRAVAEHPEGDLYRIRVQPGGPDPRHALREQTELTAGEVADLVARLARMDAASDHGPWTEGVLRLLLECPRVRAQDLAESVGLDKPTFKNDVRKLKVLGLTISHSPGYEVSPRGRAFLRWLEER